MSANQCNKQQSSKQSGKQSSKQSTKDKSQTTQAQTAENESKEYTLPSTNAARLSAIVLYADNATAVKANADVYSDLAGSQIQINNVLEGHQYLDGNVFVAPAAGIYKFVFGGYITGNNSGSTRMIVQRGDSAVYDKITIQHAPAGSSTVYHTYIYPAIRRGDRISFYANESGASLKQYNYPTIPANVTKPRAITFQASLTIELLTSYAQTQI